MTGGWTRVCAVEDLLSERGAAAIVDGVQIALFRLADGQVLAVGHRDPASGANVIARGIVGSRGSVPTVASPLHKQVYDLRTGRCLDDEGLRLPTFPVQLHDGAVLVALPGRS